MSPVAVILAAGFLVLFIGGGALLAAWVLTILARRWNRAGRRGGFYGALALAVLLAGGGGWALVHALRSAGLEPTEHVYPAIAWAMVLWVLVHVGAGVIMQLYCVARAAAGRLTPKHDIDIANVTLYWHFVAITVAVTVAVIAAFPRVA